jgi:hypothetical protein
MENFWDGHHYVDVVARVLEGDIASVIARQRTVSGPADAPRRLRHLQPALHPLSARHRDTFVAVLIGLAFPSFTIMPACDEHRSAKRHPMRPRMLPAAPPSMQSARGAPS